MIRDDTRYGHSYNRRRIETYTRSTQGCKFERPRVTLSYSNVFKDTEHRIALAELLIKLTIIIINFVTQLWLPVP